MQPSFWHTRWENNDISFHEMRPHTLLVKHFTELNLPRNSRVFVPLCGKTVDIAWLLKQGMQVVGAELNESAVRQLFEELNAEPVVTQVGSIKKYSAPDVVIYAGSIFELTGDELGNVSAIWDRAALVALPEDMRQQYVAHLLEITVQAPQLLIGFEYDQSRVNGPPFAIHRHLIEQYYEQHYQLIMLSRTMYPNFKKQVDAAECAWLLSSS